jgi:biotin transporter BioY
LYQNNSEMTLAHRLWPVADDKNFGRYFLLLVLGAAGFAVTVMLRQPVPCSLPGLSAFGTVLLGLTYGPRLGVATVLLYVFTGFAGVAGFLQVELAVVCSWLLGVAVSGLLVEGSAMHRFFPKVIAGAGGLFVIYFVWFSVAALPKGSPVASAWLIPSGVFDAQFFLLRSADFASVGFAAALAWAIANLHAYRNPVDR